MSRFLKSHNEDPEGFTMNDVLNGVGTVVYVLWSSLTVVELVLILLQSLFVRCCISCARTRRQCVNSKRKLKRWRKGD
jgi:hypothetical protein